ncbi:hypothetical protein IC762_13150 [Bradyrhizobium genosp. L]|uniref:hypothetical protein n=1 Tax=Bradyrhizobium genosp. L TaxID=83637 RepID=UPI0018A2E39B|nr:hypothetical protein [Bradyrhizobium genosp. L]QPF87172.1 hypothetical protein IC762_13150 [Bradyrhizobium genosp. L]
MTLSYPTVVLFGAASSPLIPDGLKFGRPGTMQGDVKGPEQTRIQQATNEALRVLAGGHEDRDPPPARLIGEFSLPIASPHVGRPRRWRRFLAFGFAAAASLAATIFVALYFDVIAPKLVGQAVDRPMLAGKTAEDTTAGEPVPTGRDLDYMAELLRDATNEKEQIRKSTETTIAELQQEREKTAVLTNDLTKARRDFETKLASSNTAADDAAKFRKSAETATAELERERQRTAALTSELAAARRDFEAKLASSSAAADDATELRKSAETATAELEQERQRTAALTSELAAARHDFEAKLASSSAAADDAAKLRKSAETTTAELEQERQRTAALTGELAAARRDFEAKLASSSAAADDAAKLRKSAETATAELQRERQKTAALTSELAAARRDFEAKLASSSAAADDATKLRKSAETTTAELEQERQRTAALTSELAAARRDFEAKLASSSAAADDATKLGRSLEIANSELQQERQKTAALTGELAAARRDFEKKLASNSGADDARLKTSADAVTARAPQERQGNGPPMRGPDRAQPALESAVAPDRIEERAVPPKPIVAPQLAPERNVDAEDRLVARANELLAQGNISGARSVLERAVEMGSAGASFAIAETYDPRVLSGWKTYGTRGDAAKAREFYARAAAGGIAKAKDRLESLPK